MIISCLKNFHQKTLFSEVIKSLINRMFYTISIKKCLRKNFKKKKSVYENFLDTFKAILNKYALLKEKMVRGNIVPFMTKKLKKAITNRPRIKKYQYWPSTGSSIFLFHSTPIHYRFSKLFRHKWCIVSSYHFFLQECMCATFSL